MFLIGRAGQRWDGSRYVDRNDGEAVRWLEYHRKVRTYAPAKTAFQELLESLESDEGHDFLSAVYSLRGAMKFQGDMQMRLVFAEWKVEGLNDEQLERMMLLRSV